MEQSFLDVLASARNAVVTGATWLGGIYLWLASFFAWWGDPLSAASPTLTNLVGSLGAFGLTVISLAGMMIVGGMILAGIGDLWERLTSRCLVAVLTDVVDDNTLRRQLDSRTTVGYFLSPYSTRAIVRMFHHMTHSLMSPPLDRNYFSEAMRQTLFMAPVILQASPDRFAEQQRLRAEAELYLALTIGFPAVITGIVQHLDVSDGGLLCAWALGVALGVWSARQGAKAWLYAHSQIVHNLVDLDYRAFLSSKHWDAGRGNPKPWPQWARWLLLTEGHVAGPPTHHRGQPPSV